jgi:tetratricopeptide (TPR) repeat protein
MMLARLLRQFFLPRAPKAEAAVPALEKFGFAQRVSGFAAAAAPRTGVPDDIPRDVAENPEALESLGLMYARERRLDLARTCFERVLAQEPGRLAARNALGNVSRLQQRWAEARQHYASALELQPDSASALSNLGLCLKNEGHAAEGLVYLERSLALQPADPAILMNYAAGLLDAGRREEGEARLRDALAVDPDLAEAHVALAGLLLGRGEFGAGWKEYEWRSLTEIREEQHACSAPLWNGESLAGKTILVRAEQGLGDQIMFASCLAELAARAGTCLIECDRRLKPMFIRSFPGSRVYVQHRLYETGWTAEGITPDFQVPLGSLPYRLERDRPSFPAHSGYLLPEPARVRHWSERLAERGPGLKVGISWRGGTPQTRQAARSIALSLWLPLLRIPGASFVSLQYGDCEEEVNRVTAEGAVKVQRYPEALDDYDETAALVGALDLVISVQTTLVHLAGAVGKPAWVLAPAVAEWRYGNTGETMPWYPGVRVIRQCVADEWATVIDRVAAELSALASSGKQT